MNRTKYQKVSISVKILNGLKLKATKFAWASQIMRRSRCAKLSTQSCLAVGTEVKQNEPYGTLESVKAVSDLVSAISGTIQEVNDEVQSKPETLNEDPFGKGWLLVVKPSNLQAELANLMDFDKAVEWHKAQAQSK